MRSLPPLNSLRIFEAAARRLSFNRAAAELHLTPSAVSHQIRALEEFLGAPLFDRLPRQIRLTAAGQEYLLPLQAAFEQITAATERIIASQRGGLLVISVMPAFATQWLVPRLPAFQETRSHIEVRLIVSTDLTDFSRSDVDLAIRQGQGGWPGLRCHWLMDEDLIAVCSPTLLQGPKALRQPADLRSDLLLHVIARMGDWKSWLDAAGVSHIDPLGGSRFQTWSLAMEAAIAGMGVVIVDRRLATRYLDSGRLVVPFPNSLAGQKAYYLVYPEGREQNSKIGEFREWLLNEVRNDGDLAASH
ncbi:MAG: transcriptional regulator GcvA [Gammaproteobacteria bacterium]|nr:transcriptional regulator GcvA [Gammaproteobacteria bacterium]MCP5423626.1 transcriptional regulator GcvA [Gammaproteobacteria bacterium]